MNKFKKIQAYRLGPLLPIIDLLFIFPVLLYLKHKSTKSIELHYLGDRKQIEQDIKKGAFFMTNHRDICMDSAWLTYLLFLRYGIHPYIGIGNNLFGKWWIQHVVRTLRAFVVIRNGNFRDQVSNAKLLSEYIHYLRKRRKSIWLAQREGRAKDGNDVTQPGVLKMLTIDSGNFFESIKQLNICPVCISYEYDPCDYLKAREMQLKRDKPGWKKSRKDDLVSMQVGINGKKGRMVYRMTPSINHDIDQALAENPELLKLSKNEQIQFVCNLIDQHIHAAYEIYERGEKFDQYIEGQIAKINLSNKDEDYLREKLYEMYDNQVKNYEKVQLAELD
ncbi:MAG: acyltransferase [Paludibacteraceae bacterium]|nr:acyltransferase [Paludibacteraceae bacterium]